MSTDPTLASKGTETVFSQKADGAQRGGEDAVLDDAIRRADDLLVQSLRVEERERKKRRTLRWLVLPIGVIAMLAIAYTVALSLGLLGQVTATGGVDKAARAAQLAQEGWALWGQRQLTDAEAKFEEAVKLEPELVNAWNGLGWARLNQGRSKEAEQAFKKTVELEPEHAAAENGLGQIALGQGKLEEAERHFQTSVKTPDATAAWYGLARVYLMRGNWEKAEEWAQKLVDAGQADAKQLLDAAKAKKAPAARAAKGNAAAAGATVQQGWQQLNRGQTSQAVATFEALVEKNPKDANALNGLGWALLRSSGKQAEAKDAFERAVKADPEAAGAINGLAICLKNEGNTDEAVKLWQQMVDKYPTPNAGTYGLASTYLERKEYAKAVPLFEQLVAADPSNAETKQLLAQAKAGAGK